MSELSITTATVGDLASAETEYSVPAEMTDGPSGSKETSYINSNWSQQLGYYKTIPDLKSAIDAIATWTVGKGFMADEITEIILDGVKGFGKDTFNTILENLIRTAQIGGDSFAEIITDKKGRLVNLKPLDPGVIKTITNSKGMVIRYEQTSKIKNQASKKFKPEEMFHLARNRIADEGHGESLIDAVEWIILAKNEAMENMKTLMRRHVKPIFIFHLNTDDQTEINSIKAKADTATSKGENLFVPKDAVIPEVLSISSNSTLSPLPWIEMLNQYFFQVTGVPDIIIGGSGALTEASGKIAYLAFQQRIEEEQLQMEEQVLSQLNLEINLEFPASLENEMLSDNKKDGAQNIDPSETSAEPEVPA